MCKKWQKVLNIRHNTRNGMNKMKNWENTMRFGASEIEYFHTAITKGRRFLSCETIL